MSNSLTYFIGSHIFQSVKLHLPRLDLVQHFVCQLFLKLSEGMLEGPELAVDAATESEETRRHDRPAATENYFKQTANDPSRILGGEGEGE